MIKRNWLKRGVAILLSFAMLGNMATGFAEETTTESQTEILTQEISADVQDTFTQTADLEDQNLPETPTEEKFAEETLPVIDETQVIQVEDTQAVLDEYKEDFSDEIIEDEETREELIWSNDDTSLSINRNDGEAFQQDASLDVLTLEDLIDPENGYDKDTLTEFFTIPAYEVYAQDLDLENPDTLELAFTNSQILIPVIYENTMNPDKFTYTITVFDRQKAEDVEEGLKYPVIFLYSDDMTVSLLPEEDVDIFIEWEEYEEDGIIKERPVNFSVSFDGLKSKGDIMLSLIDQEMMEMIMEGGEASVETEFFSEETETEGPSYEAEEDIISSYLAELEDEEREDESEKITEAVSELTETETETESLTEEMTEDEPVKEPSAEVITEAQTESEAITEEPEAEGETEDLTLLPLVEVPESPEDTLLSMKSLSLSTKDVALRGLLSAPVQEAVTADGMTIEKIAIKWLSSSTGESEPAGYDTLHLSPTTDSVPNQQWQIDFALSGKHQHNAGTIEIVMPAFLWKDRDGNEPGYLTLAVPEDPGMGADFSWKRVGDTIVFTNTHTLSAATKVMIQGTFRDVTAHEMVDMDMDPESSYSQSGYSGISDDLYAVITLDTPNGENVSMTSNTINAEIDTNIEASSATKTAYNPVSKDYYMYWDVPSNIPSDFLPANPEDYLYVRWYVSGQAKGNQPFTMYVEDTVTEEYGAIMLGVQDALGTNVKSTDGKSVSALLYNGYNTSAKTAYIWTAYEKSAFTEPLTIYSVHNTQTISVTGVDDLITTTESANAECSIAVPIEYSVVKEWDDNDDELGVRPTSQTVYIYRNAEGSNSNTLWKSVTLVEDPTQKQIDLGYGPWSYTWSDDGKAWHYTVTEASSGSGTFESWYDEDGKQHLSSWRYLLRDRTYDPDDRTWTFVNKLYVDGNIINFANMYKYVDYTYDDPFAKSTRDRALNELLKGSEVVVPYTVQGTAGTVDAWLDNATAGDINTHRVDVVLEDYLNMINNQRISTDDADLAYVDVVQPSIYGYTSVVKDDSLDESDPDRYYDPPRYTLGLYDNSNTTAKFEAMIDGIWVEVGQLNGTVLTASNGATASGMRLTLPEHTQQFREIVNTYGAATTLRYKVGVRIYPTDWVLGQIGNASSLSDYMMVTTDNFARLYSVDNDERSIWTLEGWDRGYLHGRVYRVSAREDKTFAVTQNDVDNKRIKIHTTATTTAQSNVPVKYDYLRGVEEGDIPYITGGTWYDLLPTGIEPDVSSVKLRSGDTIEDAYAISNYKNSGRTLLVVKAKLDDHVAYYDDEYPESSFPTGGYRQVQKLEFDAYYSWDMARKYGLSSVRNTVAFETDSDEIANLNGWEGEMDDPTGGKNNLSEQAVGTDADLMTNLHPGRNTASFVYAGADLDTSEIDFYAETSIRKLVSVEGSGNWSYGHNNEAVVYEGEKYTYRISLSSAEDTTTKDIIILDSIENYIPTDDKDDYGDSQWRGYFTGINIDSLIADGIDAKVYYSTVSGIDISKEPGGYNTTDQNGVIIDILQNLRVEGENVWSLTPPDDLSTVTAIAVDCRKKLSDGTDFELAENQVLSFEIYMRAPAKSSADNIWGHGKDAPAELSEVDPSNPDHNAHAYNNVYMDATQVGGVTGETHAYVHWDYDKVGIVPFNLNVKKEWNDEKDNDGKRPEDGVLISLLADGVETGDTVELNERNGWENSFEHLMRYDYDTMEPDYDGADDGHYIRYTFKENEVPEYEMSYSRVGNDITVINTYSPEKIDIPVKKIWEDDEDDPSTRPEYVRFKLYANGVYTGKSLMVRKGVNEAWAGTFKDLYKYSKGSEVRYEIVEDPVDDYISSVDGFTVTNTYYPYGDLKVSKTVLNGTPTTDLVDFTFTLELTDKEGNEITEKYDYAIKDLDENVLSTGRIGNGGEFKLKGGEYILISDINSHVRYRVTEAKQKGFTQTATGSIGEIISGSPAEAKFTNSYSSSGKAVVTGTKVLSGRDLEKYQFRFNLFEVIDGNEVQVRTTSNRENGDILFGGITFTQADDDITHEYVMREINAGASGYTYDTKSVKVFVTPHDNGNGSMSFDIVYTDEEDQALSESFVYVFPDRFEMEKEEYEALSQEDQEELVSSHQANGFDPENDTEVQPELVTRAPAVFENEYHATGEISLKAWKQLQGRGLTDGEFSFELLSEELDENGENTIIQTKTNTSDGSIVFDALSFTEADVGKTFYYFVREAKGTDNTVNYDDNVFGYSVRVVDNGDGTLSFAQGHQEVLKTEVPSNEIYYYLAEMAVAGLPVSDYPDTSKWEYSSAYSLLHGSVFADNLRDPLRDTWDESETFVSKNDIADIISLADQHLPDNMDVYDNDEYIDYDDSVSWNLMEINPGFVLRIFKTRKPDEDTDLRYEAPPEIAVTDINQVRLIYGNLLSDDNSYVIRNLLMEWYDSPSHYKYEVTGDSDEIPLFTNTLKSGTLTLTKLTQWNEGDEPDPNQTFRFKIRLINPNGEPVDGETIEYTKELVENIGEIPAGG